MTRLTKFRQHARQLRNTRRLLVHDAGCVFCREFMHDELMRDYIASVARSGVRIPRSMRTDSGLPPSTQP